MNDIIKRAHGILYNGVVLALVPAFIESTMKSGRWFPLFLCVTCACTLSSTLVYVKLENISVIHIKILFLY